MVGVFGVGFGCALSGRGGCCVVGFWSILVRFVRARSGTFALSPLLPFFVIPAPERESAPRRIRRCAVRQVVRFGRGVQCGFRAAPYLVEVDFAWSGLVDFVQVCSDLVGHLRSLVIPAPERESAPSRIRRFAVRQAVRFGRGVRGGFWVAPYLVGVDFAWSGLVDFVQVCSDLVGARCCGEVSGGGHW